MQSQMRSLLKRSKLAQQHNKHAATHNDTLALVKLPAELRNKIFDYLMPEERNITFECTTHGFSGYGMKRQSTDHVPAVAQTCRALRSDVLPLYYGSNIITWHSSDTTGKPIHVRSILRCMHIWLKGMEKQALLPAIQRLQLDSEAVLFRRRWYSRPVACKFLLDFEADGYIITTELMHPNQVSHAEIHSLRRTSEYVAQDLIKLVAPIMTGWEWKLLAHTHAIARPERRQSR
ncbi:hypothetical protein LTR85_009001 [Meristemomyces frigidus]|nr:hypothetical protein LTR85_009001 [Meristemomyces frigidus]